MFFFVQRYESALQTEAYQDVASSSVATQFLHTLHHVHRVMNATESWFDASCRGQMDSHDCEGDKLVDWKGKGYRTVFDVLMVKT